MIVIYGQSFTSFFFQDIHVHETHEDDKIHTIEELFPVGSQCFMLASPYYGSSGEVIEIDVKQSRIRVQLHVPPEPDLSPIINQHQVGWCITALNEHRRNSPLLFVCVCPLSNF